MRAIVSVFDKSGLVDFAQGLVSLGVEIYSTGHTKQALADAGLPVHSVEELTGFPEMLDGRVKTLHPAVHGGILARRDVPDHLRQLSEHQIGLIDLVVGNLYPFGETIANPDVSLADALEQIDIGGPTLLRAAAKNFPDVLVVVDPSDYSPILDELRRGQIALPRRRELARKAFQHVASYDTAIARYLAGDEPFTENLSIALTKLRDLRYGENPHQKAAFYRDISTPWRISPNIADAIHLAGKELSYNNILDLDAALTAVNDFAAPAVAVIKHTNPCGLACGEDLTRTYRRALEGDPVAAFGGIVGLNRRVDLATAKEIAATHYDAVVAPSYDPEALAVLQNKKGLIVIATDNSQAAPPQPNPAVDLDFRRVTGGFLVQTRDALPEDGVPLKVVTERQPTLEELTDLLFGWRVVKHVKSNAVVLTKKLAVVGVGAGQPSRVESVDLALRKAGPRAVTSSLASDAFFPFPDGVETAARGGVTAIIQPGGSVQDEKVIAEANKHHLAMVFTGRRHFRH